MKSREELTAMNPVAPVRPVAPYLGGKKNLSPRLIERIEAVPHQSYAEVFVGMAGVFLRRTRRPKAEFINDWSEDVSTFFRILQHHFVAFTDMIRFQITTRAEFERLTRVDPSTLTDLQRAARFLYLQRLAFGGRVSKRHFGVVVDRSARFDVTRLVPMLEDLHERLAGVTIERLPWADFVRRYDRPGTLFYLDPPYFGCEGDYGDGMFQRGEFEAMAAMLRGIKGRFLLSINDRPEVRRIFAGFAMEEVRCRYSVSPKAGMFGELIVSN
ncbi:MAG: DNA methyltransferase [Alphaproteobacteria bacterium HGW-Alphaproteobacteria-13]|nr:MAG: DNA methyltransferase [Alphaproteobacteria bacterium HGW-Alphaproteobacteria-13]